MGNDCEVEKCRRIIGFGFERGAKVANGFIGATALVRADAAEAIEDFGVLRAEPKRILKSFFCGGQFIHTQLSGAELEEGVERVCAAKGVGDEFGFCEVIFLLLQIKAAEVIMGFAEVVINEEGPSIGLFSLAGLAGVVISEAKVVPCLGVGGDECGGKFEFFDGLCVFAPVDEFCALKEGLGAGRSAAGYN